MWRACRITDARSNSTVDREFPLDVGRAREIWRVPNLNRRFVRVTDRRSRVNSSNSSGKGTDGVDSTRVSATSVLRGSLISDSSDLSREKRG